MTFTFPLRVDRAIQRHMTKFVTFRGLAKRTRTPLTTLNRRIRELNILPDAIALPVTAGSPSVLLFDCERLPQIRRQLTATRS